MGDDGTLREGTRVFAGLAPLAKMSAVEEEQEDPYLDDRCRGEPPGHLEGAAQGARREVGVDLRGSLTWGFYSHSPGSCPLAGSHLPVCPSHSPGLLALPLLLAGGWGPREGHGGLGERAVCVNSPTPPATSI